MVSAQDRAVGQSEKSKSRGRIELAMPARNPFCFTLVYAAICSKGRVYILAIGACIFADLSQR
jgi:hypothetical protein